MLENINIINTICQRKIFYEMFLKKKAQVKIGAVFIFFLLALSNLFVFEKPKTDFFDAIRPGGFNFILVLKN